MKEEPQSQPERREDENRVTKLPAEVAKPSPQPPAQPSSEVATTARIRRFDRIVSLLIVLLMAGTLLVYSYQAKIMKLQTEILDEQKLISNRQLHLSARPYITTKIESNQEDLSAARLLIRNQGMFPVGNLRVNYLYFAKIVGKGWYVAGATGGSTSEKLLPGGEWSLDVVGYGKTLVPPPFAASFAVEGNLQFVVFLISFEREVDGRRYVYLEPMFTHDGQLFSETDTFGGPIEGMSGALGRVCHPAIELSFEYFRRRPFPGNYEIYNYQYLLGYQPTGCLGPMTWVK